MNINKQLRINERIRVREVRLIDEEGRQAGIVQTRDALQRAKDVGFDLIEVAPTAVPPVCRIMDYGKFKYEQAKRDKEANKKSKQSELCLIRVRPNIDDHDIETKLRNSRRFLEDGDKVRVFVVFRSREFTHPEFGRNLLNRFIEALSDIANVEKPVGMEGRQMSTILAPKPKVAPPKPPRAPKVKKAETEEAGTPTAAPTEAPAEASVNPTTE
ncbi:MAG TPA: translation initiation factor IF-3 [Armatimonadota bacterium]